MEGWKRLNVYTSERLNVENRPRRMTIFPVAGNKSCLSNREDCDGGRETGEGGWEGREFSGLHVTD
jgi:hypothetical protein